MSYTIAFLGIGSIGKAMTRNLIKNGNLSAPILLWNRTPEAAVEHADSIGSAEVAASLEDAVAGADMIWSCLSTETAVNDVFGAILSKPRPGKLFVECSTISADAVEALAARVVAAGGEFVSMPVFGEPSMAQMAQLICLPCGPAASVKKVLPYLVGVIGKAVVDLSDQPVGKAATLKLVGNVMIVQMIESIGEAHVLAEKAGVPAKSLHQVVSNLWGPLYATYSSRMMTGSYYKDEPLVDVKMAQHVAGHVLYLAESCGAHLPAYKTGVEHFGSLEKYPGSNRDISGIYGVVRERSGLPYECPDADATEQIGQSSA